MSLSVLRGHGMECNPFAGIFLLNSVTAKSVINVYTFISILILQDQSYDMYRQFNIQQFYVLPTQHTYVFCVDIRTNSDYFPIQH